MALLYLFIDRYQTSSIKEIASFARGLQKDIDAVENAVAQKRSQGLSVGTYLLIAAINRAANPLSKAGIEKWYAGTILSKLIPASKTQLDSRRFWDSMER